MGRCYNPSCPFNHFEEGCLSTEICERFCPTPVLVVSSNRTEMAPNPALATNTQTVLSEAKRIHELDALLDKLKDPFQDVCNRENLIMEYERARQNHLDYLQCFIRPEAVN